MMNQNQWMEFFHNLLIVVGAFYFISVVFSIWGRKMAGAMHKKLFGLDQKTIDQFIYGYLAGFKLLFIFFVLGPYLAFCLMSHS